MHIALINTLKTLAIKAQILNWFKEDPNGKIIIYTQFMSMMYIMERMCVMEHWGCVTVRIEDLPPEWR